MSFYRQRTGAGGQRLTYKEWIEVERLLDEQEKSEITRRIGAMSNRPLFSIVIDDRQGGDVQATIRSVRQQSYPDWDLHILRAPHRTVSPAEQGIALVTDGSLSAIAGDFVMFAKSGDQLSPRALYEFAGVVNAAPNLDMIYADEDVVAEDGTRSRPFFKPDWSPDYLETFNYVGHSACFRAGLAKECFGHGHHYDFVLRFTERSRRISHVRKVLYHRAAPSNVPGTDEAAATGFDIAALEGRLGRTGRSGVVTRGTKAAGYYDATIRLRETPLVSIVVPTAGKIVSIAGRKIDLIVNCVTRVRERSTYQNIEIIVVDNGGLAPGRRAKLEDCGCKYVTYPEATINIAKKLNFGAAAAAGKILLLLNDDTEVIAPDWIERMLEHLEKAHVGVVGAKLLYPDEKIQHAGVVYNIGRPYHVRRWYPRDDAGYFFSTCGARNFMAVTGACMMTASDIFKRVGGFTEALAIGYNDLDYCMKVSALGLYVVYAPRAELFHFESQSRAPSVNAAETDWYRQKWARELACDLFYNERCLTVAFPTFEPSIDPGPL